MSFKLPLLILSCVLLLSACVIVEDNTIPPALPFPTSTESVLLATIFSSPKPTQMATVIPFQTPTIAPSLTSPIIQLPTFTPAIVSYPFQGPIVIYRVQNGSNYLLLLDIGSRTFREIKKDVWAYAFPFQWLDNGCHIYVPNYILDLQGNVVEEIGNFEYDGQLYPFRFLSPDKKWAVNELFMGLFEGEEIEKISLELVSLENPLARISLAPNNGAYAYDWSPDGNWLAFSDFDDNHILQIYRVNVHDQTIQQLTFHTEPTGVLKIIKWAPDGGHIAYTSSALLSYQLAQGMNGWVGLLTLADLSVKQVMPATLTYVEGLWWSQDSQHIFFVGQAVLIAQDNPLHGGQMYWVNGNDGVIINSFYQSQAPAKFFSLVAPVGSIETIFFGAPDGYYLLDATTNHYEKILDAIETDGLMRDFLTTPFNFPGEGNCVTPY